MLDELGYFREDLYPNEENEFMNRIQSAGFKLMYDPGIRVHRSPRPNLKAFLRMLMGYGRGRFKQMTVDFRVSNLVFFLPALFSLFLMLLPVCAVGLHLSGELHSGPVSLKSVADLLRWPFTLWAGLYALALPPYISLILFAGSQAFARMTSPRPVIALFRLPFLFFSVHFFYGLGVWWGVLGLLSRKKKVVEYDLRRMQI